MTTQSFTVEPRGPFSLREAATFGFGQRQGADLSGPRAGDQGTGDGPDPGGWDGVMRLAFCRDGYDGHAGVEVRQDDGLQGAVRCVAHGVRPADLDQVRTQVERVLSLDYDGREFVAVGERDPVIGRLQAAAPGLRPPLFYSPYEAAAWCVLSARRPPRQMMAVRDRLNQAHGVPFDLAGERLAAFPSPRQLLEVTEFDGLPEVKLTRLHGVARAALDGLLDVTELMAAGPDEAMTRLQAISGIGPFYSALIAIRGTGFADILPVNEPRLLALAAELYGLGGPPGEAEFRRLAEPWRPLRTWAAVLIRAATHRVTGAPAPALR